MGYADAKPPPSALEGFGSERTGQNTQTLVSHWHQPSRARNAADLLLRIFMGQLLIQCQASSCKIQMCWALLSPKAMSAELRDYSHGHSVVPPPKPL